MCVTSIIVAIAISYHLHEIKTCKLSEMNAIVAQAGYVVFLHRVLSKDDENYKQRSHMRTLAGDAQEVFLRNYTQICKAMPEKLEGIQDLKYWLEKITHE